MEIPKLYKAIENETFDAQARLNRAIDEAVLNAYRHGYYWHIKWFLDDKRVATVYNLVNCLLNEGTAQIDGKGALSIVPGKKIFARFG